MQLQGLFVVQLIGNLLASKRLITFMKTFFYTKTMLALAVAVAAAAGTISQAQDQPMPPPVGGSALPADIEPNTPLAEVVKLVQSDVDVVIIKNYVATSSGAFNLDADKIITLKD